MTLSLLGPPSEDSLENSPAEPGDAIQTLSAYHHHAEWVYIGDARVQATMFDDQVVTRLQDQQTIGRCLKRLRRAAGLTALEASHLTFIHHTRISRVEQGRQLPREDELVTLLTEYKASEADVQQLQQILAERLGQSLVIRPSFNSRSQSPYDYQKNYWTQFWGPYNKFCCFEPILVQGLFQIPPHAKAIFEKTDRLIAFDKTSIIATIGAL